MRATSVFEIPFMEHRATAAMLCYLLPNLRWRVHGIGLLQAYLVESKDDATSKRNGLRSEGPAPELRVHIWDERLTKPGIIDSGAMHNHRFALTSKVIAGCVRHTELEPMHQGETPSPGYRFVKEPIWRRLWAVEHARSGSSAPHDTGAVMRFSQETAAISEGNGYHFKLGAFHYAEADNSTVSLVMKSQQSDEPARILVPEGEVPEHAMIGNEISEKTIKAVLLDAILNLSRAMHARKEGR